MLLKVLIFMVWIYVSVKGKPQQLQYLEKRLLVESPLVISTASPLSNSCSSSHDCPAGSSCRDTNGRIIYLRKTAFGYQKMFRGEGTCGAGPGPKEVCEGSSGCPIGYECYREMSGYCCPPSRCVTHQYAEERRAYWANCRPPTCHFPR
ncbi:hypothetical protein SNE40_013943 [Patella caerulea]|uniref:Uncharacterized protein n=1 Tax=Patella caerulea TaxID=87958 RepID=A0AAN8PGE9_PATCE